VLGDKLMEIEDVGDAPIVVLEEGEGEI